MKSIYDYADYRKFLQDLFQKKKKTDKQFSQKRVMLELGVKSTGFMSNVLAGNKNLNPAQVEKLSDLLQLAATERKFFAALVGYDQARNMGDKQRFFEQLKGIQTKKYKPLQNVELDLFSCWYFVAIREWLSLVSFKDDYKALANSLKPAITVKEAKEAVAFLERKGFVIRNKKGYTQVVDTLLSSENEIRSSSVVAFQVKMMDLAKESLLSTNVQGRDISALTFTASAKAFERLKRETQQFRKYILELSEQLAKEDDNAASKVYQLNMQFFPISQETSA